MWLANNEFRGVVESVWAHSHGNIAEKGENLAVSLQEWNKKSFGNLFRKKKKLRARISGVQRALAQQRSHQLELLEEQFLSEYNVILEQEDTFWAQKSRVQWIQQGERNTRFFHVSTICRRRRNKIASLKDDEGQWVIDQNMLKVLQSLLFIKNCLVLILQSGWCYLRYHILLFLRRIALL